MNKEIFVESVVGYPCVVTYIVMKGIGRCFSHLHGYNRILNSVHVKYGVSEFTIPYFSASSISSSRYGRYVTIPIIPPSLYFPVRFVYKDRNPPSERPTRTISRVSIPNRYCISSICSPTNYEAFLKASTPNDLSVIHSFPSI